MNKPLPKSLHTVTVLVAIARDHNARTGLGIHWGVDFALDILGYGGGCRDEYMLRAQAIAKLNRGNV
jgi:hypothetical protein